MSSRGVNKAILIGRLGKDPEIKATPSGTTVALLSLATSESWKDKNTGEQKEKTEWHRVVIYGKLAEIAEQHLQKGSLIYVEGKMQTRKWQDNQGVDRYTTEVVLQGYQGTMQMLSAKNGGSQASQSSHAVPSQPSLDDGFDHDVPF